MKKIWLKFGSISSLVVPIITVISCGSKSNNENNSGSLNTSGKQSDQNPSSDPGVSNPEDDTSSPSPEESQNNNEGIKINKQKSFHNNYATISLDRKNYRLLNNPENKLQKPENSQLLKLFVFSGKGKIDLKDKRKTFQNQMESQGFVEYTLTNTLEDKSVETKTMKLYKDMTYFFKIGDLVKMKLNEVEKIISNNKNLNKSQVISYIKTLNMQEKNKKILISWINECSDDEVWIKAKHILKFAIVSSNKETIGSAITNFLGNSAYLVDTEIDWQNILTEEEKEYIKSEELNVNKYTNLRQLIYSGSMNIDKIAKSVADKFSSNADENIWNKSAISYVGKINGDTFTKAIFWSSAVQSLGGEETIKYILTNSIHKYKFA